MSDMVDEIIAKARRGEKVTVEEFMLVISTVLALKREIEIIEEENKQLWLQLVEEMAKLTHEWEIWEWS